MEVAEQILKSDEINLEFPSSDGEMVVFRACIRWLKEKYESRKDFTERVSKLLIFFDNFFFTYSTLLVNMLILLIHYKVCKLFYL